MKEYNSQRFTVEGAVREPGIFPIRGKTTLMQAIASAKGPTRLANMNQVILVRQKAGRKYAAVFDAEKIRRAQMPDPTLVKGDVVLIDEYGSKRFFNNAKEWITPVAAFARIFAVF